MDTDKHGWHRRTWTGPTSASHAVEVFWKNEIERHNPYRVDESRMPLTRRRPLHGQRRAGWQNPFRISPFKNPTGDAFTNSSLENHRHAVALFVAVFNFCRVHKSLNGKTPAMAARLMDYKWTVAELLSATI